MKLLKEKVQEQPRSDIRYKVRLPVSERIKHKNWFYIRWILKVKIGDQIQDSIREQIDEIT